MKEIERLLLTLPGRVYVGSKGPPGVENTLVVVVGVAPMVVAGTVIALART